MNLQGKVALVTGAGRGIGLGCAEQLARAGADIILNDRPGSEDVANAKNIIESHGVRCLVLEANIFERSGCEQLVDKAMEQWNRIDILVSNPAYSIRCNFLEYTPQDFEDVIRGTLTSGFHMGQLVARTMVHRNSGGKLIFISSVHAHMPYARSVAYNAAKAGLNHMAKTMAVELVQHRINVNCIEPGWIDTPAEVKTFGRDAMDREASQLPWGRLGTPQDIGNAAVFLASDQSDYMTGSVLRVDGGFVLKDCRGDSVQAGKDQAKA